MSLRDRILSDTNIYAAIHALPNTLREKSLICGDQQQYLKDLREVYRYGAPHDKFISHCKDKLEKALDDELSEPFKVSFFLKFKDFEDGCAQYRPIHNCDIATHVCLLAMLQTLCFEDNYEKRTRELSGLSKLIPNNYWGNRISTNGNEIYKPWAPAYTSYIRETINKAKKYKNNKQYNNEVNLDFKDFFPSINLGWLSNTIKNKLYIKYTTEEDRETLNRILELLLYFEIDSVETYNDRELSIYYGQPTTFDESTTYYTKGLPQGLPHTYFFANIAMAEIEPYIRNEFDGDADFYVDDAVIFCNCDKNDFKSKVDRLNFLFDISDINSCNYSEDVYINDFQKGNDIPVYTKTHSDWSAFFFLSDIYTETIIMSDINNKNRLRKKSAPSYSEIPSGDVHPSILGSATDTAQTSKDADANIVNVTKGAKNNIKKFLNNDFPIDYNGGYKTVVIGLRQLLKLRYKGGSNYAKYQTPNGIFSFRLSDHNANGNNFENNEINISVYVAYHEYDVPESEVKYTEYKITPQLFENEPQSVVLAIVKGISKALNGESFSLDDTIATGDSFPKETLTDNNVKTEARKMNHKNTIILTETELKNVIAESVKRR